jgi:hypothetical protein
MNAGCEIVAILISYMIGNNELICQEFKSLSYLKPEIKHEMVLI